MSSRFPRRSFATPFVLTLAAIPACVASSQPPPQTTTTTTTSTTGPVTRDHRDDGPTPAHDHTHPENPPAPTDHRTPPPPPEQPTYNPPAPTPTGPIRTPNTGNQAPTGGMAPGTPSQPVKGKGPVAPISDVRTDASTAGRAWTLTKRGETCEAYLKVNCPTGAICNPPPPAKYACPPDMTDKMSVRIDERTKGSCWMDPPPVKCPQNAKCATPPAKQVDCPK